MSETAAATIPGATAEAQKGAGEIRLSFGYFYLVLKWGQERRSSDRLEDERRKFPVLTATHMPVLAALWGAIFLAAYYLLVTGLEGLAYLFS